MEMKWHLISATLAAAATISVAGSRGEDMATERRIDHAAAWCEADTAVSLLRREFLQSPRDTNVASAAFRQLDGALSAICASQRSSQEAQAAPPLGPVSPTDSRPDPSERALRERLTMQTHRPAGPTRTSPVPPDAPADEPCREALAAMAAVQALTNQEGVPWEQALLRLETALVGLRKTRP